MSETTAPLLAFMLASREMYGLGLEALLNRGVRLQTEEQTYSIRTFLAAYEHPHRLDGDTDALTSNSCGGVGEDVQCAATYCAHTPCTPQRAHDAAVRSVSVRGDLDGGSIEWPQAGAVSVPAT